MNKNLPTVQCEICQLEFTSEEANKHTEDTGDDSWFLLMPEINDCGIIGGCEGCEFRDMEYP